MTNANDNGLAIGTLTPSMIATLVRARNVGTVRPIKARRVGSLAIASPTTETPPEQAPKIVQKRAVGFDALSDSERRAGGKSTATRTRAERWWSDAERDPKECGFVRRADLPDSVSDWAGETVIGGLVREWLGVFARKIVRDLPYNRRTHAEVLTQTGDEQGDGLVSEAFGECLARFLELAARFEGVDGDRLVSVWVLMRAAVGKMDAAPIKHQYNPETGELKKVRVRSGILTQTGANYAVRAFFGNYDSDGRAETGSRKGSRGGRVHVHAEDANGNIRNVTEYAASAGRYGVWSNPVKRAEIAEETQSRKMHQIMTSLTDTERRVINKKIKGETLTDSERVYLSRLRKRVA